MIFIFLLCLGVMIFWLYGLVGWAGSLSLISYIGLEFPVGLLVDDVSLVCFYMLICCGSIALFYCFHYFGYNVEGVSLFFLIIWFLGVMGVLIFSSSLIFSLVCWEYLGLVSFFLILFYSNGVSLRASLVTLFASRFGDVALFMLVLWFTWGWCNVVDSTMGVVLLFLVVITKSAGYPFISWLLEAMRAPTPVSSLVHSSTLVAAGVWFLLRYEGLFSGASCSLLLVASLFTIFISGLCACFFIDLKKIVALSTCNNISWCLVFFLCGDVSLCLLQLLTHGVCKCYLFMSVGDLMSSSGGSQSAVGVYSGRYTGVYGNIVQMILILSLCGLPFIGVFFSKHAFFSGLFYIYGGGCILVLLSCFFLSYIYSLRFIILLLRLGGGISSGYSSGFTLIALVSFLATVLNYGGSVILNETSSMGFVWSMVIFFIPLLGCLGGCFIFLTTSEGSFWDAVLWGGDCVVSLLYSCFLGCSAVCLLSVYRWEVYLSYLVGSVCKGNVLSVSFFSLNLLVCGFLYLGGFHFLLGF